jgi:hypothetical protein
MTSSPSWDHFSRFSAYRFLAHVSTSSRCSIEAETEEDILSSWSSMNFNDFRRSVHIANLCRRVFIIYITTEEAHQSRLRDCDPLGSAVTWQEGTKYSTILWVCSHREVEFKARERESWVCPLCWWVGMVGSSPGVVRVRWWWQRSCLRGQARIISIIFATSVSVSSPCLFLYLSLSIFCYLHMFACLGMP